MVKLTVTYRDGSVEEFCNAEQVNGKWVTVSGNQNYLTFKAYYEKTIQGVCINLDDVKKYIFGNIL